VPQYVFTYRAPGDYAGSPEEASKWRAWFQTMGAALNARGEAVFDRVEVGECRAETNLGGYSLITADSMDQAVELAAGCPLLCLGGGVEVGELTPVS
jgi:hypothetical protein